MSGNELAWRTSSYSGTQGGNCVQVAGHGGLIWVRDTKEHGRGPVHRFTAAGWAAFLAGVRHGDFDQAGPGRLP